MANRKPYQFQPQNQFWKNRTKHGRNSLFNDPEALWQSATEYFEWCDCNPLMSIEYYGKDAKKCTVPKMRAYTYSGLCVYLDCDDETFHGLKNRNDFLAVYTRICKIIYTQKFEGASAGLLNHNIIARDLGLVDKQETVNNITMSSQELKDLAASINR